MEPLASGKERKHRGRMWGHGHNIGEGQDSYLVQVQAGAGQVEVAKNDSAVKTQATSETAVNKEVCLRAIAQENCLYISMYTATSPHAHQAVKIGRPFGNMAIHWEIKVPPHCRQAQNGPKEGRGARCLRAIAQGNCMYVSIASCCPGGSYDVDPPPPVKKLWPSGKVSCQASRPK